MPEKLPLILFQYPATFEVRRLNGVDMDINHPGLTCGPVCDLVVTEGSKDHLHPLRERSEGLEVCGEFVRSVQLIPK
jgi:hypothetical protein